LHRFSRATASFDLKSYNVLELSSCLARPGVIFNSCSHKVLANMPASSVSASFPPLDRITTSGLGPGWFRLDVPELCGLIVSDCFCDSPV
jgi:hypothetical protein